jgi:glycosyltransferase involved in cell wall biosynthesis
MTASTERLAKSNDQCEPALLEDIGKRLGRPLRVLHIGNIANNAFNNARIQRAAGIAADVLCYDYYHVMGTPEWEEANFDKPPEDPYFPDWWALDLKGYQRPRWFASGPMREACNYLEAWISGREREAIRLWSVMERERFIRCSKSIRARMLRLARKATLVARKQAGKLARNIVCKVIWCRIILPLVHIIVAVDEVWPRFSDTRRESKALFRKKRKAEPAWRGHVRSFDDVNLLWNKRRPGFPFPALQDDIDPYLRSINYIGPLLQYYDIIQGYSIDGIWPLLAGRPYAAYEHGTLRSLPFENSGLGHTVALCFGLADQVMITNLDCLASADRLGLNADRIIALPHAFDDQRLRNFAIANADLRLPVERLRLFTPTRQDWRDGDPSLAKGNDKFIRAAAQCIKEGMDLEIIAVRWGRDVQSSVDLAAELGVTKKLHWVDPMRKEDLWRAYLTSHAIIDQFELPAFGGVTFEALALGRRVVTSVDMVAAKRFFGEPPPLYRASSPGEIIAALRDIAADPADIAGMGVRAMDWIGNYHSAKRIIALQVNSYRKMLDALASAS